MSYEPEPAPDSSWLKHEEIRDPGSPLVLAIFLWTIIAAAATIYLVLS